MESNNNNDNAVELIETIKKAQQKLLVHVGFNKFPEGYFAVDVMDNYWSLRGNTLLHSPVRNEVLCEVGISLVKVQLDQFSSTLFEQYIYRGETVSMIVAEKFDSISLMYFKNSREVGSEDIIKALKSATWQANHISEQFTLVEDKFKVLSKTALDAVTLLGNIANEECQNEAIALQTAIDEMTDAFEKRTEKPFYVGELVYYPGWKENVIVRAYTDETDWDFGAIECLVMSADPTANRTTWVYPDELRRI